MVAQQRRLTLLLAAALLLACGASLASARLMVVQQDVSSDVPGVTGRTYYVLSSQPEEREAGPAEESALGAQTWEEGLDGQRLGEDTLSLSATGQDLSSSRSISVLSINPFSWLRQQLEAVEALQRATLLSWFVPLSQEPEEVQQLDELRRIAGDADVQEQLLVRLGCSRFHAAMAEYSRQAKAVEAASSDDSSSSFGFFDGDDQEGQERESLLQGSSARLSSDADTMWAFGSQLSMASLDEGSSASDMPVSDADAEWYIYYGSGEDDSEEYYADYELQAAGGQDSADLSELRAQVRTAMIADSVVRLLVRDAYSEAYNQDALETGSSDYNGSGEDGSGSRTGGDVDDYGIELALRDALMAELIESEYFSDDYGDDNEDYASLLAHEDDDSDPVGSDGPGGLDQAWADYLEDAYEYEYINYGYYDDDEEVPSTRYVGALLQDGPDSNSGASELVAWTQNGELVLALLPRFSAVDEQYLPGEAWQGVRSREGVPFPPVVDQLDLALVNRDGSVNWGLVTLCLLAGGTLAMFVGFVASWLSLRRTMGRRHVYVPFVLRRCSKSEQSMLATPLLGGDYGFGCGGKQLDVEYAAEHVDAGSGSNESIAKALYK